ncbi:N-acetylmuramoyl-L-alanine amidase [Gordonia zhaorongruii]|uniref:N-acetylmuramoyl-L-alanine amidase n=1 Tax=Gordonia zhaorongruii TaxID=2597659 RepID=UPI00105348FE|nr:N-acetylmuramoyl-L-alanine amidase [Gordonia zhaorongruii]
MAWTGDPVWLADVLRAEGLRVVEHDGWRGRGHGDFRNILGVLCHHTAGGGADDWRVVQYGRPDLPGPLAQLVLERDGTVRVIAVGVCWHAGRGSWPGWPTDDANWHTIGIEAVNDGRGQVWPAVQLDAYKRICAAIARRVGFGAGMVVGHKEYSSEGKIDPAGIEMAAFRADVASLISEGAPRSGESQIASEAATAAWLGDRITDGVTPTRDGVGRFAEFRNGAVYWNPRVAGGAAIAVPSHVHDVWQKNGWEQGFLGYPVRRHAVVEGVGDIQAFQGGVVYRRYGEPGFPVRGVIGDRWAMEGYEVGPLGWPVSDEYAYDGGKKQDFENGSLVWHPSGAVKERRA